jgi:hypothetical protein
MSLVPIALRIYRIVWHHRLLTMLPVSSSFFTLRYVRVQVVDAMHPSEAGPQKKLPLFLWNQRETSQERTASFFVTNYTEQIPS